MTRQRVATPLYAGLNPGGTSTQTQARLRTHSPLVRGSTSAVCDASVVQRTERRLSRARVARSNRAGGSNSSWANGQVAVFLGREMRVRIAPRRLTLRTSTGQTTTPRRWKLRVR